MPPSSSSFPVTASWNVDGLTPEVWQHILDTTRTEGIQIWLLQEWRSLATRFGTSAALTPPTNWACINGPTTAILLSDRSLRFGTSDNGPHSSRAIVHNASGDEWLVASLYIPVHIHTRRALLRDADAGRQTLLLQDILSVPRCIVGGDMNIHNSYDHVEAEWEALCLVLDPLQDSLSSLHPFSNAGTRRTHAGRWRRLDHIFTSEPILDQGSETRIVPSDHTSDHLIVTIRPLAAVASASPPKSSPTWQLHPRFLRDGPFRSALRDYMSSHVLLRDPDACTWEQWCDFVHQLRGWLLVASSGRRDLLDTRDGRSAREFRTLLDDAPLDTPDDLQRFASTTHSLQLARHRHLSSEHAAILHHEYDLSTWFDTPSTNSLPALDEPLVLDFFGDLFAEPHRHRQLGPALSSLLRRLRTWSDPAALEQPFDSDEIGKAIAAMDQSSAAGFGGIPAAVFKGAPTSVFAALAAALNDLRASDALVHSCARVSLLYKNKPGNDPSDPAAYRPISVLDVTTRWIRAIIAKRIRSQLAHMLPPTQTAFIQTRSGFANGLMIELLQASLRYGWLQHPVLFLEQDQEKAFDKVSHSWQHHVLQDLGTPPTFHQLLDNLSSDFSLRFLLAEGLSSPLVPRRGLAQGAADSPALYLLLQEPFFDLLRRSRTAVPLSFCDRTHRIHFMAFADNCFFILGSAEAAAAYLAARRKYDIASGSSLNTAESTATILVPPHDSENVPQWARDFETSFHSLSAASPRKLLGKFYVLEPTASIPLDAIEAALSRATGHGWGRFKSHIGVFAKAQLVNQFILARCWHILDVGYLASWRTWHHIEKLLRARLQPFLHAIRCKRFRWDIVITPKPLGGLGVLPPILQCSARFASSWARLVLDTSPDSPGALFRDSFQHWLWTHRGASMATLLLCQRADGPQSRKAHLVKYSETHFRGLYVLANEGDGEPPSSHHPPTHEDFFHRLIDLDFQLTLSSTFDFSTISPAQLGTLPWSDPALYRLDIVDTRHPPTTAPARSDIDGSPFSAAFHASFAKLATFVLRFGFSSWSDILWICDADLHTNTQNLLPVHVGPPTLLDCRNRVDSLPRLATMTDDRPLRLALTRLHRLWPHMLAALRPSVLNGLQQLVASAAPPHASSPPRPLFARDAGPSFPWQALRWNKIPFHEATTRRLRLSLSPTVALLPAWLQPRAPHHRSAEATNPRLPPADSADPRPPSAASAAAAPIDASPLPPCLATLRSADWKSIWLRFHSFHLPGLGHESWFLLLHGLAPRPTVDIPDPRHANRFTVSTPDCALCSTKHDFIHAYLQCPATLLVWEHCWRVLQLFCSALPPWSTLTVTATDLLLCFPSFESTLPSPHQFRLRTWFVLMVQSLRGCFADLQGLSAQDTPLRVWTRLLPRLATVPTTVVRGLFRLASGQRTGPDALQPTDFATLWLSDNSLFAIHTDTFVLLAPWPNSSDALLASLQLLHTPAPVPIVPTPPLQPAAPDGVAPPLAGDEPEPPGNYPPAPAVPRWRAANLSKLACGCCHIRRVVELNTRLCIPCWRHRYPDLPFPESRGYVDYDYTRMACACGRARRAQLAAVGDAQNWSPPGSTPRCSCCSTPGKTELNSKLCYVCWRQRHPTRTVDLPSRIVNIITKRSAPRRCGCRL